MIKIIKKKEILIDACVCSSSTNVDGIEYGENCGSECLPDTCWIMNDPSSPIAYDPPDQFERNWGGSTCWTSIYGHYITSDVPQNPKPYVWTVTDPCPEFTNGTEPDVLTFDWFNDAEEIEYCRDTITCPVPLGIPGGTYTYTKPVEDYECGVWAAGLNSGSNTCGDCLNEDEADEAWSI